MTLTAQMTQLAQQAKVGSRALAKLTTAQKDACLLAMADALESSQAKISEANAADMAGGAQSGLSGAMLDRLKLDEKNFLDGERPARSRTTARQSDESSMNGFVQRPDVAENLHADGVVVIIYESRPIVTADAAGLASSRERHDPSVARKPFIRTGSSLKSWSPPLGRFRSFQPTRSGRRDDGSGRDQELLALTQFVDLCTRGGESLIGRSQSARRFP